MGKLDGKVAFISGAARGQGRSHALRLAEEGANVISIDACAKIASIPYEMPGLEDLEQTAAGVRAFGRECMTRQVDVRDEEGVIAAVADGVRRFGRLDVVLANAGVAPCSTDHDAWAEVIDINLTGVFNTVEAVIPHMVAAGNGGAIVITSSTAGINGVGGATRGGLAYTASKHGVVGLMRSYANILSRHSIRVNSIHPTGVRTPMVMNDAMAAFLEQFPEMQDQVSGNALPVDVIEPSDISSAVLWLVSDEGRYVTGITLPVDAGFSNKR